MGVKKLARVGARVGGRGAGNGAGSGSVRNRFERRAKILPLPLRSHALTVTLQDEKPPKYCYFNNILKFGPNFEVCGPLYPYSLIKAKFRIRD